MVRYHVQHDTRYHYDSPVALSHQLLHLQPRDVPTQTVLHHALLIDPVPSWQQADQDSLGNPVLRLGFDQPHQQLHVQLDMQVAVCAYPPGHTPPGLSCEALRRRLAYRGGPPLPADLAAKQFLFESPHVRIKHELADYAAPCFAPDHPVLAGARKLMEQIHQEFEFDTTATTVSTPVLEVLANKRGVCQDFSHLMLACLRALGIPARYVSGYLLTQPPPGQPRLLGADASHAWIAVYAPPADPELSHPATDWVDLDPTNKLLPFHPDTLDTPPRHITLAWGRDFSDVSPMRGVILGGGDHDPQVAVTVTPLD